MRIRAIFACLWFGIMPWQVYEHSCHYAGWGYWKHLLLNLESIWLWVTFQETEEDRRFEAKVNPSWRGINWLKRPAASR